MDGKKLLGEIQGCTPGFYFLNGIFFELFDYKKVIKFHAAVIFDTCFNTWGMTTTYINHTLTPIAVDAALRRISVTP